MYQKHYFPCPTHTASCQSQRVSGCPSFGAAASGIQPISGEFINHLWIHLQRCFMFQLRIIRGWSLGLKKFKTWLWDDVFSMILIQDHAFQTVCHASKRSASSMIFNEFICIYIIMHNIYIYIILYIYIYIFDHWMSITFGNQTLFLCSKMS